ncbi:DNA polymerase III subunit beta [Mycoplasmatota bacterium]|nr:DNA polymerase III subunit beta [Mycoplasmatota bacterium]
MIFSIDRESLVDALTAASRALSNKTPMPILTGVKIDVDYNKVTITTSNSDISMQVVINNSNLKVEKIGSHVIPGRFFIEIAKKIKAETVEITVVDDNLINIKAGQSDFTLNGMEKELYPEINFNTLNNPIILRDVDLRSIIYQTNFATSVLENRPILTGVLFDINGHKLKAVATDSYRLAQKEIELNISNDIKQIVIPHRTLEELSRLLTSNEKVEMFIAENKVIFKHKNVMFQSRLLEGRFPETNKLIPTEFPVELSFSKNELISAIERASLLYQGGKDNIVKLQLKKDGNVIITSHSSEVGKVIEEIKPTFKESSGEFAIAFSAKYVMESLRVFESSDITMYFTGVVKPFIIKGELDEGMLQLVLPVRVE